MRQPSFFISIILSDPQQTCLQKVRWIYQHTIVGLSNFCLYFSEFFPGGNLSAKKNSIFKELGCIKLRNIASSAFINTKNEAYARLLGFTLKMPIRIYEFSWLTYLTIDCSSANLLP